MALIDVNGDILDDDESFSNRHRKPKVSSKSILNDTEKMDFTDKIKQMAEQIYGQMEYPVRKDAERKRMIFCCILFAHAELDIIFSPREIARKVGVNDSTVSTHVSKYSMNRVNYHPPQRFYSVADHAKFLMNKIKFDNIYHKIVMQTVENLCKNLELTKRNIQPDLMAAGIILYESHNMIGKDAYETNLVKLKSLIICKDKALSNMYNEICKLDNGDK